MAPPPPTGTFETSLPEGVFFKMLTGVTDPPPPGVDPPGVDPPPPPTTFKSLLEEPPLTSGGRGVTLLLEEVEEEEEEEEDAPLDEVGSCPLLLNVVEPDLFNVLIRIPPPPLVTLLVPLPVVLFFRELVPPSLTEDEELVTDELPGVVGVTGVEGFPPRTAVCIARQCSAPCLNRLAATTVIIPSFQSFLALPLPLLPFSDDEDDDENSPLVELAVLLGVVEPTLGVFALPPGGVICPPLSSAGATLFDRRDDEDFFVFVSFEDVLDDAKASSASSFVNDALDPAAAPAEEEETRFERDSVLLDREPMLLRPGVLGCCSSEANLTVLLLREVVLGTLDWLPRLPRLELLLLRPSSERASSLYSSTPEAISSLLCVPPLTNGLGVVAEGVDIVKPLVKKRLAHELRRSRF